MSRPGGFVDGVKDHVIPHLSGKKTTKDMWEALVKLYQSDNQRRKMLLRENLRSTKMAKGESVVTYLTKFTNQRWTSDCGRGRGRD
jgi:hypothetical protein